MHKPILLFDREDYLITDIVNRYQNGSLEKQDYPGILLNPHFHPRGIKEVVAPNISRMVYVMLNLLESFKEESPERRVAALRILQHEVLHNESLVLPLNTSRVLVCLMKDLVRTRGSRNRQIELAHDFRSALSGKTRIIRKFLDKYSLLEVPEENNHISFDDHVHDIYTKGRKTPTHLVLDAWLKGIKRLTVVYYNTINIEAVKELLDSAGIMNIDVTISVEIGIHFHNRLVYLICNFENLKNASDCELILGKESVRSFFESTSKIGSWKSECIFELLHHYNSDIRKKISAKFDMDISKVSLKDFLRFVGPGQPSLLHLSHFIYQALMSSISDKIKKLDRPLQTSGAPVERKTVENEIRKLNRFSPALLSDQYLKRDFKEIQRRTFPDLVSGLPHFMKKISLFLQTIDELNDRITITLNLTDLTPVDVLELLYDSEGGIKYLEIFNAKDYVTKKSKYYQEINTLRTLLNKGDQVHLRSHIIGYIRKLKNGKGKEKKGSYRIRKLKNILKNFDTFFRYYRLNRLETRIGSDSTSTSDNIQGMGFAALETLTPHARKIQRKYEKHGLGFSKIPVRQYFSKRVTYVPKKGKGGLLSWMTTLPILGGVLPVSKRVDFRELKTIQITHESNITSLSRSGSKAGSDTNATAEKPGSNGEIRRHDGLMGLINALRYLNTNIKHVLKILLGFVPAFLTFYLTKDWWVLAYFGGLIWFAITGLRNIIQSILAGRGSLKSSVLPWREYVDWGRVSDSLLFTGFSIPLLDWIIKTLLLDNFLHINMYTSPILLYTVIAFSNGIYIMTHNTLRNLPKEAIYGNLFRTPLSIPIAFFIAEGIQYLLILGLVSGGMTREAALSSSLLMLQNWATVISKFSSDIVAGVIEGLADRKKYLKQRMKDYREKIQEISGLFTEMQNMAKPMESVRILDQPANFLRFLEKNPSSRRNMIIDALDLFHFWLIQPQARKVFPKFYRSVPNYEKRILSYSLEILKDDAAMEKFINRQLTWKKNDGISQIFRTQRAYYLRAMEKLSDALPRIGS